MAWPAFPVISLTAEQNSRLPARLAEGRQVWGPQAGADSLWRLQPRSAATVQPHAALPVLPLKKLLFPDNAPLWEWSGDAGYAGPPSPPSLLLVGIPLCDLQALAWLDLCFADDEPYRSCREALLVVGAPCHPVAECACQLDALMPGGDLFLDGQRLWALSPCGKAILEELAGDEAIEHSSLPEPGAASPAVAVDEQLFAESAGASWWDDAAARCLACGACSAVCPTCTCYEVLDEARPDGSVSRRRKWDNCFFPDHARVAGGYDFRAGRGRRLRFRFEHKYLGFGPLRGIRSCVGCGRCRRSCPVGIDLAPFVSHLTGSGRS